MRRWFARTALVLAAALTLAACAAKQPAAPKQDVTQALQKPFESTVNIQYKDLAATAKIAREAPGYCKITFASPASLADMALEFTADQVNVTYKKLSASFRPDSLPGSAVSSLLVSVIDRAASKEGVHVDYADGALTVTGELENDGSFTLALDPDDGSLLRLSVPQNGFEAEFSNFSLIA